MPKADDILGFQQQFQPSTETAIEDTQGLRDGRRLQ